MTGGVGSGDKDDSGGGGVVAHGAGAPPGSVPTSAWCSSSSVGNYIIRIGSYTSFCYSRKHTI